jgi:hypothetical protein
MHFPYLECIFPTPDKIVVALIPQSRSGNLGSREFGQGAEVQPVKYEAQPVENV